jgi:hypothetical protein
MNWKRTVGPIEAPPFMSPQNVSSSAPVMLHSYRRERLCNEPCGVEPQPPGIIRPGYEVILDCTARGIDLALSVCPQSLDGRRTLRLFLMLSAHCHVLDIPLYCGVNGLLLRR